MKMVTLIAPGKPVLLIAGTTVLTSPPSLVLQAVAVAVFIATFRVSLRRRREPVDLRPLRFRSRLEEARSPWRRLDLLFAAATARRAILATFRVPEEKISSSRHSTDILDRHRCRMIVAEISLM
jgi:hypothetical protein